MGGEKPIELLLVHEPDARGPGDTGLQGRVDGPGRFAQVPAGPIQDRHHRHPGVFRDVLAPDEPVHGPGHQIGPDPGRRLPGGGRLPGRGPPAFPEPEPSPARTHQTGFMVPEPGAQAVNLLAALQERICQLIRSAEFPHTRLPPAVLPRQGRGSPEARSATGPGQGVNQCFLAAGWSVRPVKLRTLQQVWLWRATRAFHEPPERGFHLRVPVPWKPARAVVGAKTWVLAGDPVPGAVFPAEIVLIASGLPAPHQGVGVKPAEVAPGSPDGIGVPGTIRGKPAQALQKHLGPPVEDRVRGG